MSAKAIFVFCAQALLIQSALSQCAGRAAYDASAFPGFSGYGLGGPAFGSGLAGSAFGSGLAGSAFGSGLAYDGLGSNWAGRMGYDGICPSAASALDFTPTSGGGLPVSSLSSNSPVGISVMSENAYEGLVSVAGELPFVGTAGFEGVLPSAGVGVVNHACGNGINAMSALSDTSSPASVSSALSTPYGASAPFGRAGAFGATGLSNTAFGNGAFGNGAYGNAVFGNGAYGNAAFGNGAYGSGCPLAASAFGAPGYAASGFGAPGFAGSALGASALAASGLASPALAYDGNMYDNGVGYADGIEYTATSGGALPVSSSSCVAPTGIAVASETAYEGPLTVTGELPFVGTVGLEGVLPTAGAGVVNHACGNGRNAMSSDGEAFATGYGAYGAYAPAGTMSPASAMVSGYNYPSRWAGKGYGCGL